MGADFLFAAAIMPNEAEERQMRAKIDVLKVDDVPDLIDIRDCDIIEARGYLHACLDDLMRAGSECGGIFLGGRVLLITGGMSYGDSPTELCDSIWDLANAGVLLPDLSDFELRPKPVDPALIAQAQAFLEGLT